MCVCVCVCVLYILLHTSTCSNSFIACRLYMYYDCNCSEPEQAIWSALCLCLVNLLVNLRWVHLTAQVLLVLRTSNLAWQKTSTVMVTGVREPTESKMFLRKKGYPVPVMNLIIALKHHLNINLHVHLYTCTVCFTHVYVYYS